MGKGGPVDDRKKSSFESGKNAVVPSDSTGPGRGENAKKIEIEVTGAGQGNKEKRGPRVNETLDPVVIKGEKLTFKTRKS